MKINNKKNILSNNNGQALVTLLFFMIIAILLTSASIVIMFTNSLSANSVQQADTSYYIAESGVENAILRLLRDPGYTGETLTIGDGNAIIQVDGINPVIATSTGTLGNFKHTIQITGTYNNNVFSITGWKELY